MAEREQKYNKQKRQIKRELLIIVPVWQAVKKCRKDIFGIGRNISPTHDGNSNSHWTIYNLVKRMNLPSFSQMYPAKREVPKPVAVVTKELLLLTLTEMYDWPDGDIEQAPEVSMASLP